MQILYEDNALLLAEKPVGVLSEGAPEGGSDMVSLLTSRRRERGEPAEVFPVHRLDRGVGGLMVFAKDKKTAGRLSAMMGDRTLQKDYYAVVHGIPAEPEGTLRDLLFRDAARNKTYVVKRERRGVREARLTYRLLETVSHEGEPLSLLRVRLGTGRTHQVRVQFASRRLPLWGDGKYGAKDNGKALALFSCRLAFPHPVTGKPCEAELLPPSLFPWELFGILRNA